MIYLTLNSYRNRRLQKKLMSQVTSHISEIMEAKKTAQINKDSSEKPPKVSSTGSSSTSGVSSSSSSSSKNSECLVIPLISLPRRHCLPSARAILAFILHLDYTCNVDTFLIACKISIIDDDLTVSDDAMFSKLSAPIPWGVGPNSTSATEPKISSCDFFKTYMTGLNDFTDASTSTPPETGSSATGSATYSGASTSEEPPCSAISWSSLLLPPPQQVMVIERMHSGARRFIVLDFGRPILLTDLFIAACSELLSLSIDIWTRSEEADGIRLVVTPDIALKNLILSDIQPPPICRYLKITTIGRYGMSTAKCKIPVGSYYGHTLVLPGEDYADKNATTTSTSCDTNIKVIIQCIMLQVIL
ncbi:uncharacterized protein LOC113468273 [Diaphorina citri]|uniref:Uncharacterized protein LOC113468273 n=1 Tax=Diaphorina citri TaxID=121845 RepID=A0A3Q0IX79_DIACI|nr:uncharacterized protein LOC113468273 [Diaphorina citri]